jgi:Glutathione S-transferase, N-terminal domain
MENIKLVDKIGMSEYALWCLGTPSLYVFIEVTWAPDDDYPNREQDSQWEDYLHIVAPLDDRVRLTIVPNPRRVRVFAAEKGIELALEDVDILTGQSRTPDFLAKNSSGAVPVLELDDGSYLSESVAICRYLEGLQPEPNLFGRDLREQVEIERWNRRMELELFAPIARTAQNTSPNFQNCFKQFPEYGEA